MNATPFTPGPWRMKEGKAERHEMTAIFAKAAHFEDQDAYQIGWVITEGTNKKVRATDLANARLITAAPELAAALAEFVRYTNGTEDSALFELNRAGRKLLAALDRGQSAIATAERGTL